MRPWMQSTLKVQFTIGFAGTALLAVVAAKGFRPIDTIGILAGMLVCLYQHAAQGRVQALRLLSTTHALSKRLSREAVYYVLRTLVMAGVFASMKSPLMFVIVALAILLPLWRHLVARAMVRPQWETQST